MTQTVKLTDGSVHNFPDEATPDMIAGALGVSYEQEQPSVLGDVSKSIGSNLVGGALDLAMTLPNLVNQVAAGPQMLGRGIADTVSPLLGAEPQPRGELWQPFFSSYDAEKAIGTDYEPKTTAGNVVILPARIVGGVAGAKGLQKTEAPVSKFLKNNSGAAIKTPQATSEDIKNLSRRKYAEAEQFGGVLKPSVTNKFISEIEGMAPQTAQGKLLAGDNAFTKNSEIIKQFKDQPITLQAAQEIDEILGDKIDDFVDRTTGALSKEGKKLLDIQSTFRKTLEDVADSDTIGGKEGFAAWKEGQRLWSAQSKLRDIEKIITRAELTENQATAIKTGFKNLYSNPARMRGYDAETKKLIRKAAETGIVGDLLGIAGSRLGPIFTMATGTGGLGGAAASQATAMAARGAKTKLQIGRANRVANTIANKAMNPPIPRQLQNFPSLAAPLSVAFLESQSPNIRLPLEDLRQKLIQMRQQ